MFYVKIKLRHFIKFNLHRNLVILIGKYQRQLLCLINTAFVKVEFSIIHYNLRDMSGPFYWEFKFLIKIFYQDQTLVGLVSTTVVFLTPGLVDLFVVYNEAADLLLSVNVECEVQIY